VYRALDARYTRAPLSVNAVGVSVHVHAWVNKSAGRVGDVGVGGLTSVAPVELVGAATLNVQASKKRNGMLGFAVLIVKSRGRHAVVVAARELRAIGAQWAVMGGGGGMDEAASTDNI